MRSAGTWAEFTDGSESDVRMIACAPEVGDRTWWLDEHGCTLGCVIADVTPVHRSDGITLRVLVGELGSDD